MTEIKFYSLNDFNSIMFDNFEYKLPSSVYDIINDLTLKLGITNNNNVSVKKEDRIRKMKSPSSYTKTEENWEHIKPFKATVIIENKDGLEKTMNEIRICLNKISAKNYETNKNTMLELMGEFIENSPELEKIANIIFDIASTNKFFSEIYAELYKCLLEKYEIFRVVLNSFLEKFTHSMRNIQYVDQKNDYDAFCKYNKMNDYRKASSVFIVNLVKKNVLDKELLLKLINEIQDDLFSFIDIENKTNEVDEITENIFLLISESHSFMKTMEEWKNVVSNVEIFSKYKAKEHNSLSSRAIFKYMDIMDKLKM
jgi:hypothetical protein